MGVPRGGCHAKATTLSVPIMIGQVRDEKKKKGGRRRHSKFNSIIATHVLTDVDRVGSVCQRRRAARAPSQFEWNGRDGLDWVYFDQPLDEEPWFVRVRVHLAPWLKLARNALRFQVGRKLYL